MSELPGGQAVSLGGCGYASSLGPVGARRSPVWPWLVALLVLVAASLRIGCALLWPVGFDEAMHMFIAKVPTLQQFWRELQLDTHPPLHHLLLRWLPGPEHGVLGPRAVSIVCSLGSLLLTCTLLGALGVAWPWRLTAGLLLAVSHAETTIGVSVRSYSVGALLLLLVWRSLLPVIEARATCAPRALASALLWGLAACWAVYAAVFVLVAIAVAILFGRARQPVLQALRHPTALGALGVACAGGLLLLGFVSQTVGAAGMSHVAGFLGGPDEGLAAYAQRGCASLVGCFTPWTPDPGAEVVCLAVAVLAVSFGLARRTSPARAVVLGAAPIAVILHAVAGWFRLYPFGGEMRHQYLLFPLFVLAACVALDAGTHAWAHRFRLLAAGGVALASIAGSTHSFLGPPLDDFSRDGWRWDQDVKVLARELRPDDVLYLNQFNAIAFYGVAWQPWRAEGRYRGWSDRFAVDCQGKALTVLRPQHPWAMHLPLEEAALRTVAEDLRLCGLRSAWIVALQWDLLPPASRCDVRADSGLAARCARQGLDLTRSLVLPHGQALYVSLR